jgi:MobA/MobL family
MSTNASRHYIDARIDHCSHADQGVELEPQKKIGPAASRMERDGLEPERIAEHAEIARRNGDKIIAEPGMRLMRSRDNKPLSPSAIWRCLCTAIPTAKISSIKC